MPAVVFVILLLYQLLLCSSSGSFPSAASSSSSHGDTSISQPLAVLTTATVRKPAANVTPGTAVRESYLSCREMIWLHCPKTSSTFCLTLQHICTKKSSIDEWARLADMALLLENNANKSSSNNASSTLVSSTNGCISLKDLPLHFKNRGHDALALSLDERNVVFVMRDPVARLVSSFLDSQHHGMFVVFVRTLTAYTCSI